MNKVLLIKDKDEFRKRLNLATIRSVCVVADVERLLKDYERDVIEFEVEFRGTTGTQKDEKNDQVIIAFGQAFKGLGKKLQVFVVKKKDK